MAWIAMSKRTDENSCPVCNGNGGLMDDETIDNEGLPFMKSCPQCCGEDWEHDPLLSKPNAESEASK